MIELDTRKLPGFDKTRGHISEAKRAALDQIGKDLQNSLRGAIAGSIRDSHGKVQSWQQIYKGSGGGYVAIRPVSPPTGPHSPGAITNYLQSGHAIRPPTGKNQRYRPRIHVVRVAGRGFYTDTAARAESIAQSACRTLEQRIKRDLEADL